MSLVSWSFRKEGHPQQGLLLVFVLWVAWVSGPRLSRDLFGNGLNLWVYTDWLIDYSAGFVRRGLSGELIGWMARLAPPRVAVGVLVWSLYGVLVLGYVRLLARSLERLRSLEVLALLFLPCLLPFYLHDPGAFGRKETLGFVGILWHLACLERSRTPVEEEDFPVRGYFRRVAPLVMLFLPAHILMHEASFFLFVPVHLLITRSILAASPFRGVRERYVTLALMYAPVALTLGAVLLLGRPEEDVARAIHDGWVSRGGLEALCSSSDGGSGLPGSLKALSWTFLHAASLTLSLSGRSVAAWVAGFVLLGSVLSLANHSATRSLLLFDGVGDSPARRLATRYWRQYFLLPLLLSLPLYVMGSDLGRWFVVSCINYSMITLSGDLLSMERTLRLRPCSEGGSSRRFSWEKTRPGVVCSWVVVLLVVLGVRLPHAVNRGYNMLSAPFGSLLESRSVQLRNALRPRMHD